MVEGDGEVIFERGSFAHDLAFLVDGEVGVMSYDSEARQRRISPTHSILLVSTPRLDEEKGSFEEMIAADPRVQSLEVVEGV